MNIKAKVFKVEGKGNLKANASITLDDKFVVTGLRVMQSSNGLFVSMPSYKAKDGTYKDTSFPLNKELRQKINDVVLKEYDGDVLNTTDDSFPFL